MKKEQIRLETKSDKINTYMLILAGITLLVFGNSLFNGYNFDDTLVTLHHPYTSKGLKAIGSIFTSSYYTNHADVSFGYRPITHLSFAIEHQFFGEKAGISHLINLLIYIGCVIGFFKLISNWFGPDSFQWAFFASLIFAVHPIHTEAVDSIKNRDELLAFLFLILSFLQVNKFASNKNWIHILFATLFFSIGLLSKKSIYPMVFVLPLFLLYIKHLEIKTIFWVSAVLVLFASIFSSDFVWQKMLILFVVPMLFVLFLMLVDNFSTLINRLNTPFWLKFGEYALMIISLALTIASIYFEDYLFFTTGCIFTALLFFLYNYKPVYLLLFTLQLLAVGYFLEINILPRIAFLLSSLAIIPMLDNRKANIISLFTWLLAVLFIVFYKFNVGQLLLLTGVLLVIFMASKNKWIATGLLLLIILVSFIFFHINYFHIVLVGIAIPLIWALKDGYLLYPKIRVELLVVLFVIPIAFFSSTQRTVTTNYLHRLKAPLQVVAGSSQIYQAETSSINYSEGRSLNYVENTLVGNQTVEAKLTTGIITLSEYTHLLFFPNELLFYYGFAKIQTSNFSDGGFWFGLFVFVLFTTYILFNVNRNKLLFIGAFWMVLCLLLFSNWIELVAGMVGERLAFSASAGFCILLAALFMQYKPKLNLKKPGVLEIALLCIIIAFSVKTIARNADWKSASVLMEHDMEYLEQSAYANHMYALNCMNILTNTPGISPQKSSKLIQEAENSFKKSTQIYPKYFNANFDLARLYIMQNNFEAAKPYLDASYQLDSTNLFVLEELAKTCFDLKLANETIHYAKLYLNMFPQNENIYEILTYTLFLNARYYDALQSAEHGLHYYPRSKNLNSLLADIKKKISS